METLGAGREDFTVFEPNLRIYSLRNEGVYFITNSPAKRAPAIVPIEIPASSPGVRDVLEGIFAGIGFTPVEDVAEGEALLDAVAEDEAETVA